MLESYALPAYVPSDGTAYIATAFLAKNNLGPWLITAAHVPTRSQPTLDFERWPPELFVIDRGGGAIALPLFSETQTARIPNFKFLVVSGGVMGDVIAIPLSSSFDKSPVIDLRIPVISNHPPGPIVGYGYPDKGGTWPYCPADEIKGYILKNIQGAMYEGTLETQMGHSGGPVFSSFGNFVGMMIGSTDGKARIISDLLISALIDGRVSNRR